MQAAAVEKHHHGWSEVEAEVTSCKFMRGGRTIGSRSSYYAVGFLYKVDGVAYRDGTVSFVEVQPHDKFAIRYNPEHPDQNNSLESECERPWFNAYLYLFGAIMVGLFLYHLLATRFGHY